MTQGIPRDIVTGAFSYTGRYVTQRLLNAGREVRTITSHPSRPHSFGDRVQVFPYDFDQPDRLVETLRGADTLYSTYWVRYPFSNLTFERAVENSKTLFLTAKKAGVRRIVHVSIANPSKSSPLAYYSGKAHVEEALLETGLSYAIFRPTVIFGKEDILINNIAWMVRHFPVFAVPGDGQYKLQPIYVEDFADALVDAGTRSKNEIRYAVGPESF
jgi:NADH dehydrogenase